MNAVKPWSPHLKTVWSPFRGIMTTGAYMYSSECVWLNKNSFYHICCLWGFICLDDFSLQKQSFKRKRTRSRQREGPGKRTGAWPGTVQRSRQRLLPRRGKCRNGSETQGALLEWRTGQEVVTRMAQRSTPLTGNGNKLRCYFVYFALLFKLGLTNSQNDSTQIFQIRIWF